MEQPSTSCVALHFPQTLMISSTIYQLSFTYKLILNIWDSAYDPSQIVIAYQYLLYHADTCPQGPDLKTSPVACLLAPMLPYGLEDASIALSFLQQAGFFV